MKKPAATRQKEKTFIEQLSQAELVEMVLGLQKIIEELQEKLAIATGKSRTTSQTSSKPPSTDLLQKPEKPTLKPEADQKRNQVDNQVLTGKTRKGFGRVDRTEISSPDICLNCGSKELSEVINIHRQQVASLVAKPIEGRRISDTIV
jgi:transposase